MFGEVPGFHTVHVSLFAILCSGIGDGDLRLHQEMLISDKDWDFDGDSVLCVGYGVADVFIVMYTRNRKAMNFFGFRAN